MEYFIKLELFSDDKLIEEKFYDVETWYDGDIEVIDSEEYRKNRQITLIKGKQYEKDGVLERAWSTFYDESGRLIKVENYDSSLNLIEVEEITYNEDGRN